MKPAHIAIILIFLITIILTPVMAQNPKTNAGKVNNKPPQGYKPPAIPTPPPQRPVQKDSGSKMPVTPVYPSPTQQVQPTSTIKAREPGNQVLLNIGLIVGLSEGDFRVANNNAWGIGFGITCMYNFMGTDNKDKSPVNVYLGGAFEYLYFGGKSNSYHYDDPYPYNGINNKITTSLNSNIYTLMLTSRVEFFNGPIVPFIEGAIGGRLFDGTEKVTVDRTQNGSLPPGVTFAPTSQSNSHHLQSDIVGTYGYGGGIKFTTGVVGVEAKLMYMKGTNGRYIKNESVTYNPYNGKYDYGTKTSTTDMLLPQLSLSLSF